MKIMNIDELIFLYKSLLHPVFGEQLRIDDSEKEDNWVTIVLDGEQEDFCFSLYGTDCVHLYWCNECFIFDKRRNGLVSSDTYGEIVFEEDFDVKQLPYLLTHLILRLKDCTYIAKKEKIIGKIPSGYDDIKEYVVMVGAKSSEQTDYQLANITIKYIE